MDKREFLAKLQEKLENADISPDIDLEVKFFKDDGNPADEPKIVIKYYPTESDMRQNIVVISEDVFNKSVEDAYNYITFQIEQFEEEIDSIEFSGE